MAQTPTAPRNELLRMLDDLREKREAINGQVVREEEERRTIQADLAVLNKRLNLLNESITRKNATRAEHDRAIADTENAYVQVVDVSQQLLGSLKRESARLNVVAKLTRAQ